MKNTVIFPNSTKRARAIESAERAQRILEQMQRSLANPTADTHRQVAQQSRQLASAIRGTSGLLPVESALVSLADRMASISQETDRFTRDLVNKLTVEQLMGLGTPGRLISSLLRSHEGQEAQRPLREQIRQAVDLLSQFAPQLRDEPVNPEQAGGRRVVDRPEEPAVGSGGGFAQRGPARLQSPDDAGPHPNVRILSNGNWEIRAPAYHRVLRPDDPRITGQMTRVSSSNVYSIGFQFNFDSPTKSMLIIRYKQKDRRGSGSMRGGPTYEYGPIHPDWFDELVKASSKGKWVWDELRIRGTVAGHQYPYNLTRAAQGYLPRRAFVQNGIERLQQRERVAIMPDGSKQVLRSPLPNAVLGRYSPSVHKPNVGNMDRGAANRGTPNRGR